VAASLCVLVGLTGITYNVAALAKPSSLEPTATFTTQPKPKASTPAAAPAKPLTLPESTPTHITITSQDIDVDLIPVGLNADGSMETPPVLDWVAGWYKYSPTPGELGPAVIVGHVDSYQGISVFWNLRNVQAGDTIDVAREDGGTAHFRVTQLAQYDQNSFPTDTVYGNTSDAELRVITCGGTFDTSTGHYTQNTVVYATLVS
jgi:sortase (surface protein transpeptidase)